MEGQYYGDEQIPKDVQTTIFLTKCFEEIVDGARKVAANESWKITHPIVISKLQDGPNEHEQKLGDYVKKSFNENILSEPLFQTILDSHGIEISNMNQWHERLRGGCLMKFPDHEDGRDKRQVLMMFYHSNELQFHNRPKPKHKNKTRQAESTDVAGWFMTECCLMPYHVMHTSDHVTFLAQWFSQKHMYATPRTMYMGFLAGDWLYEDEDEWEEIPDKRRRDEIIKQCISLAKDEFMDNWGNKLVPLNCCSKDGTKSSFLSVVNDTRFAIEFFLDRHHVPGCGTSKDYKLNCIFARILRQDSIAPEHPEMWSSVVQHIDKRSYPRLFAGHLKTFFSGGERAMRKVHFDLLPLAQHFHSFDFAIFTTLLWEYCGMKNTRERLEQIGYYCMPLFMDMDPIYKQWKQNMGMMVRPRDPSKSGSEYTAFVSIDDTPSKQEIRPGFEHNAAPRVTMTIQPLPGCYKRQEINFLCTILANRIRNKQLNPREVVYLGNVVKRKYNEHAPPAVLTQKLGFEIMERQNGNPYFSFSYTETLRCDIELEQRGGNWYARIEMSEQKSIRKILNGDYD